MIFKVPIEALKKVKTSKIEFFCCQKGQKCSKINKTQKIKIGFVTPLLCFQITVHCTGSILPNPIHYINPAFRPTLVRPHLLQLLPTRQQSKLSSHELPFQWWPLCRVKIRFAIKSGSQSSPPKPTYIESRREAQKWGSRRALYIKSSFQLQITASVGKRTLRATWATIAAPIRKPTLIYERVF